MYGALGYTQFSPHRERTERPGRSQIDTFCQWAEDAGFPSMLLVWDGMLPESEYSDSIPSLAGRGRIVCASSAAIAGITPTRADNGFVAGAS